MTSPARRPLSLLALCLCAMAPGSLFASEPFTFTDLDRKLLAEVELLDRQLERDGLVHGDRELTDYVTRLGLSLVPKEPGLERVTWRFRVLRDPLPNAFALPNGSIYVHSGLLGVLENDDQLASVLAHEVTHVTGRHSYLSFRSYRKKSLAINLIGFAGGAVGGYSEWTQAVRLIAGATQVILAATINGYSRELERQADVYALDALVASGHNPGQMAAAFRRLQGVHDLEQDTIFYTDHPKLEDRIAYVTELAGTKRPTGAASDVASDERDDYRISVERVSRETVQLAIDARRHRSALALAQRLMDGEPAVSHHAYLLAEAYRTLGPRTARPEAAGLTSKGRKDARRLRHGLTAAEEEQTLSTRPEGQDALRENQQKAETLYLRALELDPHNYKAHRGLGLLFERAGRKEDALAAYRQYLELGLDVPDRERIRRRMDALTR